MKRPSYELTPAQRAAIKSKLSGKVSFRELAKMIGSSHQQAINIVAGVAVQWVCDGTLVYKPKKGHGGHQ